MKNYEITFKNGLLIDKKTGKRLHLKPFETYYLQGDDDSFLLDDYVKDDYEPLNSEEKLEFLQNKYKKFELAPLAPKGTKLIFRIGLGKRSQEDTASEYLFEAIIQEDLYIKNKFKSNSWSLCDCVCKCTELLEGDLGFPFQAIEANSLSELFANVVSTYFNKKRSTACNAFKTYYILPKDKAPSLTWYKNAKGSNLDIKRKAIKIKHNLEKIKNKI